MNIEYTEKLHAERLLHMLEKEKPCVCCPKIREFKMNSSSFQYDYLIEVKNRDEICNICKKFIGIDIQARTCPCSTFVDFERLDYSMFEAVKISQQEAIKRTWIALEEKGYLDYEDNTCNPSDD